MDLGELADGDQVVRCRIENTEELGACLFVAAQLEQGAAKSHSRGEIRRVLSQAGFGYPDGFLAVARPAILFRELRKSNRRRILENPASKILYPRVIRHA